MKHLFLALLFPLFAFAQTNYSYKDILAQRNHNYQTIFANRSGLDFSEVAEAGSFINDKYKLSGQVFECGKNCNEWVYKNTPVGDIKPKEIRFKLYWDVLSDGTKLSKKVIFTGDDQLLTNFYVDYWNTTLDFETIKQGEVASVRFLSDVATYSLTEKGASIVVETAKTRFN